VAFGNPVIPESTKMIPFPKTGLLY